MPEEAKYDIYETDSEDDDYVPAAEEESASELSDKDNDAEAAPPVQVDEEERKREREKLWANFQASVSEKSDQPKPQEKMVKVERKYLFAGKEAIEVIEVPENSADARKWPLWKGVSAGDAPGSLTLPLEQTVEVSETPTASDSVSSISGGSNTTLKPPAKRPGPRKPKTKLAALPGPAKAKKITTLDKSSMDWKAHIQTQTEAGSSVNDELEANRRSGGYLEKVEFLKRVEARKEESLESLKSNKRRRL